MELRGSKEYRTISCEEVVTVVSGELNIYVAKLVGERVLRSVYLCTVSSGACIPGMSYRGSGEERWVLRLFAVEQAEIQIEPEKPQEMTEIRNDFISVLPKGDWKAGNLPMQLVAYLEGVLLKEEESIRTKREESRKAKLHRHQLLASPFLKEKGLQYHSHTPNDVYNTMCVLCNYLKIKICSYQSLEATYGQEFDVFDIARMSHFVVRTIALKDKWFLKDGGAFLAI